MIEHANPKESADYFDGACEEFGCFAHCFWFYTLVLLGKGMN